MNQGGVVAVANLRGGSEYGDVWHEGGMLLNKQNVFDDFAYAAKFLHLSNIGSNKTTVIKEGQMEAYWWVPPCYKILNCLQ